MYSGDDKSPSRNVKKSEQRMENEPTSKKNNGQQLPGVDNKKPGQHEEGDDGKERAAKLSEPQAADERSDSLHSEHDLQGEGGSSVDPCQVGEKGTSDAGQGLDKVASRYGVSGSASAKDGGAAAHEDNAGKPAAPYTSCSSGSRLGCPSQNEMGRSQRSEPSLGSLKKNPSLREGQKTNKIPTARQPWFPTRSTTTEDHIPLENRESFRNRTEDIRELERRSRESSHGIGRSSSLHPSSF